MPHLCINIVHFPYWNIMKSNFSNQYYIYNFLFPCQEGVALKTLCSVYSNEGEYMGKCGIGRTIGYSENRQLILFWLFHFKIFQLKEVNQKIFGNHNEHVFGSKTLLDDVVVVGNFQKQFQDLFLLLTTSKVIFPSTINENFVNISFLLPVD